jgi:hypothetical protein
MRCCLLERGRLCIKTIFGWRLFDVDSRSFHLPLPASVTVSMAYMSNYDLSLIVYLRQ